MICVIADDLTGAAELGATGHRHGLRAQVVMLGHFGVGHQTLVRAVLPALKTGSKKVDLLCFDTDSRACRPTEAARRAAAAAQLALRVSPTLIYKKTDSVLRGPVAAEIKAIIGKLGKSKAVLVPANPSRGRVIKGGQYYINGKPIHLTEFAADPLHPRTSSDVCKLIEPFGVLPVYVCRPADELPCEGIIIGEAETARDLALWTCKLGEHILPAGGADFFGAILSALRFRMRPKRVVFPRTGLRLFVCGTYSESAHKFVARARRLGIPIFTLLSKDKPHLNLRRKQLDTIAVHAVKGLRTSGQAILFTGDPLLEGDAVAERLIAMLTTVALRVLESVPVKQIYIEGGATAAALLGRLGWTQLTVETEIAPGVVTLRPEPAPDYLLTIKPGSYTWPELILSHAR